LKRGFNGGWDEFLKFSLKSLKKDLSAGELTEGEESLFLVDFFRLQPASPTDPAIGIPRFIQRTVEMN
jgi:hypothetical protein